MVQRDSLDASSSDVATPTPAPGPHHAERVSRQGVRGRVRDRSGPATLWASGLFAPCLHSCAGRWSNRDPGSLLNLNRGASALWECAPLRPLGARMEELPEIDGIVPVGVVTKIRGTGQRIERPAHLGERMLLLVEAEIDSACQLKQTDEGPKLHQGLKILDLFEVTDDDQATSLMRTARSMHRIADDADAGRIPLTFGSDTRQPLGVVDGSGVVLTPAEVFEARGVDVDPVGDVLVVEFADGTKGLWPDDWQGTDQELAAVGGEMRPPGAEPGDVVQVLRLLDEGSGEPIDEWTEEDEERRLVAEDLRVRELEEAEAREDLIAGLEATVDVTGDAGDANVDDWLALPAKDVKAAASTVSDPVWLHLAELKEEDGKARSTVLAAIRARREELDAEITTLEPETEEGEE